MGVGAWGEVGGEETETKIELGKMWRRQSIRDCLEDKMLSFVW